MRDTQNDKTLTRPYVGAIDLTKEPDADKNPGVRLYCSSPGMVTLQIRSVGSTARRRGGVAKHIVSSAEMDAASARQIIVWLQRFIAGENF